MFHECICQHLRLLFFNRYLTPWSSCPPTLCGCCRAPRSSRQWSTLWKNFWKTPWMPGRPVLTLNWYSESVTQIKKNNNINVISSVVVILCCLFTNIFRPLCGRIIMVWTASRFVTTAKESKLPTLLWWLWDITRRRSAAMKTWSIWKRTASEEKPWAPSVLLPRWRVWTTVAADRKKKTSKCTWMWWTYFWLIQSVFLGMSYFSFFTISVDRYYLNIYWTFRHVYDIFSSLSIGGCHNKNSEGWRQHPVHAELHGGDRFSEAIPLRSR